MNTLSFKNTADYAMELSSMAGKYEGLMATNRGQLQEIAFLRGQLQEKKKGKEKEPNVYSDDELNEEGI